MKSWLVLLVSISTCAADTIRIRVTHEAVGVTNVTTEAIRGSNRVELIKEFYGTNRVDRVIALATVQHSVSWAVEAKKLQVVNSKESEKQVAFDKIDKNSTEEVGP